MAAERKNFEEEVVHEVLLIEKQIQNTKHRKQQLK